MTTHGRLHCRIMRHLRDEKWMRRAVKECLDDLVAVHERAAGDLKISNMDADGQTLTINKQPVNRFRH